jgi:hypothetical protein
MSTPDVRDGVTGMRSKNKFLNDYYICKFIVILRAKQIHQVERDTVTVAQFTGTRCNTHQPHCSDQLKIDLVKNWLEAHYTFLVSNFHK